MISTESKKKSYTLTKKYFALYSVLFIAAILIMVDHYYETPMTVQELKLPVEQNIEKSEVGFKAPGFTVRNLKGNRVRLADYQGQVVILNFWATWCGPCRVEMPGLENLYRRFRARGVTVLAVSLDRGNSDKVQKFADGYQLSFPVLVDPNGQAESRYRTLTIPTTYVIDKRGMVVAVVDGAKNWESQETFDALEYLLKAGG
ncbi:MAG: redoxin domain-containing protein [Nitrospinaceae bacterium]|nr:TlpA family protein disulfide reductase [Nitrospinaceae bacterium]NIR54915.1 TlpA family protein disulfide reductase [Nitrospinaceae bacterium]NIS84651.1 TlpA family protein disulfide reductase [Nitrospinaceae bacterium]NIT81446.1 TlpA family protein disulfide reductase [Nitrospinaceae bacterium]NIU43729.1 TlpA family protein disulfide reductase [Nitrospinaceae bacterium]